MEESRKTLRALKRKQNFSKALSAAVATGVVSNIFTKNTVPVTTFNIYQTDWSLFATAVRSIPDITARAIQKDINRMVLHYKMPHNEKHLAFWEGIKYGCK